jgi:hypothetical protein
MDRSLARTNASVANRNVPQDGASPLFIVTNPEGLVSKSAEFEKSKENDPRWDARYGGCGQLFHGFMTQGELQTYLPEQLKYWMGSVRGTGRMAFHFLDHFLANRIYALDENPNLITLPEQNLEITGVLDKHTSNVREYMAASIAERFMGNIYTLDGYMRTAVGRYISIQKMYDLFPEFCMEYFGDRAQFEGAGEISIRRTDSYKLKDEFMRSVRSEDIENLMTALKSDISQGTLAWSLKAHWAAVSSDYQGISYINRTDDLDGSILSLTPKKIVNVDWALEHVQDLGTVADWIKENHIKIPRLEMSYWEWAKSAVPGLEAHERKKNFRAGVDRIIEANADIPMLKP